MSILTSTPTPPALSTMNKNNRKIFSRREVEARIAAGHVCIISKGEVLQLDHWLDKHPGGRLAILHMVGRDATDEINVYHSSETLQLMKRYRIGRIAEPWVNFEPPIRGGTYREHTEVNESDPEDTDDRSDNWSSSLESYNSSTTSLDSILDASLKDRASSSASDTSSLSQDSSPKTSSARAVRCRSRTLKAQAEGNAFPSPETYIASAEQQEIDNDIRNYPSLDAKTQLEITKKYQALHQRVKDGGFYDCRYAEYGKEMIRYTVLFAAFLVCLRIGWYMTSASFLGLFWHQIMFTAHDAGHIGITHNFVADTLIGIFIGDFCCGLSIGWWKSSHNVHHLVTNDPEHDPDVQNVPLFAISPSFFRSIASSYYDGFVFPFDAVANVAVKYQRYTYYPIMAGARFNLYVLSWLHLISKRSANLGAATWTRPTEIAAMCCFWYLFAYLLLWCSIPSWKLRVAFVLVSHIVTFPLHIQITLSHWAMPTADLGPRESFPQRQLRTTMDVACPAWLDFFHGGLQFQVVHHLFPRVPRHNLRKLQVLVREFCEDTGIPYHCYGFKDCNKMVLGRLEEVARQVEMLIKCQLYMAETGESGLH